MNRSSRFFVTLSIVLAPLVSDASAYGVGTITAIGGMGFGTNTVYFGISPAPTGRAGCNSHANYQFIIDISTDSGKALYSMILSASATNTPVAIQGAGTCPSGTTAESVSYWVLNPQ